MTIALFRQILALGTLAVVAIPLGNLSAQQRAMPAIEAKDLNERPFSFPRDVTGTPAIAVFAYRGKEQEEATRVLTMVARLTPANPGITGREFPVISVPGLMQGVINNGMRGGIPSVQTRAKVITLYVPNIGAWRRATGFTNSRGVYVAIMANGMMKASIASSALRSDADLQRFIDANR